MTGRRAVITGMGVIAPNATGLSRFWQATLEGRSGIKRISRFDTSLFQTKIAGSIDDFDPTAYMEARLARRLDRFAQLGLAAAKMAVADSGLDLAAENRERIGSIIGSGLGGVLFHEEQMIIAFERGANRLNPFCVPRITPNAVSSHIGIELGLMGPNMVISTACASGTHAVGESLRKIRSGEADVVVTGGVEAPLTQFTFGAYCAMRVLSRRNDEPERASRPFDRDRDGFVLSEGAAALVVEELDHARKRGARIYAELAGYGLSCGAHNIVIPEPTGSDAARTIRLALADAGLAAEQLDYINAHGTSTPQNDVAETRGIKTALGDHAYRVAVSSTKSMIGHSIGATGAIEAVVCAMAIHDQIAPPTINLDNPDPECDLDYVPGHCREMPIRAALSNSFGFGNANACLAFTRFEG